MEVSLDFGWSLVVGGVFLNRKRMEQQRKIEIIIPTIPFAIYFTLPNGETLLYPVLK